MKTITVEIPVEFLPALLNRNELAALSSLICDSIRAEESLRNAGYAASADRARQSRETAREVLYRTNIWERP